MECTGESRVYIRDRWVCWVCSGQQRAMLGRCDAPIECRRSHCRRRRSPNSPSGPPRLLRLLPSASLAGCQLGSRGYRPDLELHTDDASQRYLKHARQHILGSATHLAVLAHNVHRTYLTVVSAWLRTAIARGVLAISPKVGLRHPSCFNTLVCPILSVRLHPFKARYPPSDVQTHPTSMTMPMHKNPCGRPRFYEKTATSSLAFHA